MRNIRLVLAYDGSDYVGWQIQPNGVSVQAVVQEAIRKLTGEEANLLSAGRTDSGVHAVGQVANFHTNSSIPADQLRRGLQNFLPEDVVVRAAEDVPAGFHATYDAIRKRYRYVILNDRVADPFLRRYAWRFWGDLDVEAMNAAAAEIVGKHDFRCFESHWPNKATSVRTVEECRVYRTHGWPVWWRTEGVAAPQRGRPRPHHEETDATIATADGRTGTSALREPFVCLDIVADGFLYNMVRAIMGTLIKVGRGTWSANDVARIIVEMDRDQAGETAPACGLYLLQVEYPPTD